MSYILLGLAFICNSIANILLKVASTKGISFQVFPITSFIKDNLFLFVGLFFFVINAIFYALSLKNLPISFAYPVMVTMSLLIIGTYASLRFGEQFTIYTIVGYSLIILGIVVIFMQQN